MSTQDLGRNQRQQVTLNYSQERFNKRVAELFGPFLLLYGQGRVEFLLANMNQLDEQFTDPDVQALFFRTWLN